MGRTIADIGVDLGTACTRVVVRGRGIVLEEPSVVALQDGSGGADQIVVGAEARKMLGRNPSGTEVIRPIRGGVIADFEVTEQLLQALLKRVTGRALLRPRVLVCIPAQTTEVERRAVQESARTAGARQVMLVATPLAASLGAGLPMTEPVGNMIVDVGAGQTEVAITSLGGLVSATSVRVAGDDMDEAIVYWLRSTHNLLIGERTAEEVKQRIGHAIPHTDGDRWRVRGRDVGSGRPREVELATAEIAQALAEPIARIRETVLQALQQTPPELSADIVDRGVILCGGASQLPGLDEVLREATGLAFLSAEDPFRCAARGAEQLLDDPELLTRALGASAFQ